MKVAIVTQGYLVGGGVPAVARWLRDSLTEAGHDLHVHDLAASSRDERSRRVFRPATWRTEPSAAASGSDSGLFHWGANWVEVEGQRYRPRAELTKALNSYDLIQVVAGAPALALAAAEALPPKVLQVATTLLMERRTHLPEMPAFKRAVKSMSLRWLHRLEVRAVRGVDHVLVENRFMEQWVRQQGQPNVTHAPPGIDTDVFQPNGEWDPTRPIIAFGRLGDSRKDWPSAIEAYERFVASAGLENRLVLGGRGPMASALVRKLEESPLRKRITVREDVPTAELPSLLASCSVFLQSSLEEGLGLAGLEAMACGLPVVATRTVGSAEYVRDGENGFLVDVGSGAAEQLASSLAQVLNPVSGGRMSRCAVRTVSSRFSSTAALASFMNVYQGLVGTGAEDRT